ncbi:MAG TPA: hypothetical protein VHT53_09915 [Candidatus Elarobacter sp.]|jgi:hypothetical protein|nr:hypothetical protein [Candidatus Elarobacter sp.]
MSAQAPSEKSGTLEFADFVHRVDAALRSSTHAERFDAASAMARWTTRERTATVESVAPRNVSVTLDGAGESAVTTWYPCDAALVAVVSRRIASYLGEA